MPTNLTTEQREALRAFGEAMGENISEGSIKSFFDKHKKKR